MKRIVNNLGPEDIVVGTTGMLSRELYEYRYKFIMIKGLSNTLRFLCSKNDNFQMQKYDIFLIFAQNIDCG